MAALPLKDFNLNMKTENPAKKATFQWSIRNIRKLPRPLHSSKFSLVSGQPRDWHVSIYLEKDKFKFTLTYHGQKHAVPIQVESHSRILRNEGSVLVQEFDSTQVFYGGEERSLFYPPIKVYNSKEDKIVFQCSMTVHGYGLVCSRNLYSDDGSQDIETLRNDYLRMMNSDEFKDVKIRIRDGVWTAHKCVLRHRAPKFFSTYEEGILNGEFTLMGVDPAVFHVILESIYGGKINRTAITKDYKKFYRVAFRYQLRRLLKAATKEMKNHMMAYSVCNIYMLADESKDEEMVKYCETFMKNNLHDLESNIYYDNLCASRPHLPRSKNELFYELISL